MPDPLFGPEIRLMLAEDDRDGLRSLCEDLHPARVAAALDEFTPAEVWEIISPSNIRTQAAVLEYLPVEQQVELVEADRAHAARLIGKMSHDDRVDLLRRLPPKAKEALLRLVDEADRKDIATLFEYGENTVGALMTTDYAWLPPTMTAAEAIDQLRQQAPDRETIYYVYVLGDPRRRPDGGVAPRKLLGVTSLRDLILAPRTALVKDLMSDETEALNFRDDREKAAEVLARYDFIAMPVTDDDGGMLGIVTHDDVIDVIQQEATEDLQRQGGVSPLGESYARASFYRVWRSRAMWLSVLFVAELGTFHVMGHFQETIDAVVVLALFVPLCISTGGNSGSQASTLITRALALGEVAVADWARVLRREFVMGIALGLTLGLIGVFRGALTDPDLRAGPRRVEAELTVRYPGGRPPAADANGDYPLDGAVVEQAAEPRTRIRPPDGGAAGVAAAGLTFPAGSVIRSDAVGAWRLGLAVGLAVFGICLWGTLVGAALPLVFKRLNRDPAIASGPFVATFVDITGIFIFFSIAKTLLL
jgi:magnesium transporter